MNKLIRYFELAPSAERGEPSEHHAIAMLAVWWPQYVTLVAAITIQPYFEEYQKSGHWSIEGAFGRMIFGLVVGILIFPSVYKGAFDNEKPIFLQLCAIFAAGMGWQSLLLTGAKAAGVTS